MIRLALLLLGAGPLRRQWWAPVALSLACLVLGLIFVTHWHHVAITFATDIIGAFFVMEGVLHLLTLATIGFPNATIPVLKSLGFFALGFISIDMPWDDNIVATVVLGTGLAVDGVLRLAGAAIIRSSRWKQAVLVGLIELTVCVLVWTPWPVPRRQNFPFCIGIALIAAAWSLLQLGLQLRRLPAGASITNLPLFAGPNWHARGVLPPAQTQAVNWRNEHPLRVHVWTPLGSSVNPQRRLIIDRYVAAIDQNGVISTGHASLSLPPSTYVSLRPAEELDRSPDEFGRLLRASANNDVRGHYWPSLQEESENWCSPDREIRFHYYNRDAVQSFLAAYQAEPVYNLTRRNCSSTVVLTLDAAMEGALGGDRPWRTLLSLVTDPVMWLLALWRARAEAMTWTPGLVLDYAEALQHLVDRRRQKWFERLVGAYAGFWDRRRIQQAEDKATTSSRPAIISLVATAMIFGLSYGLSAPLLALSLTQLGFSKEFIGANAAMHAVGVLAMAPVLPSISWRIGPKLPIAAALLAAAATLALFPVVPSVWIWFPLRIILGAASETLFVMSETWLNQLSTESTRTRNMALYTAAISLGFALGPLILTATGTHHLAAFLIGGLLALLALLSIAMPWVRAPTFERPAHRGMVRYLALAPVAVAAVILNASLETAGMSLLPLYAMRAGWGEQPATLLLSLLLLGAILLQLPIGWLGDRVDRRRLVMFLSVTSAFGALAWPLVIDRPMLAYPLMFVWGGAFVGIYTVMMALVGSRFKGGDLVSVYGVMSIAWGVGAFIGPGTAGAAMDLTYQGLPLFAAAACLMFALFALFRREAA